MQLWTRSIACGSQPAVRSKTKSELTILQPHFAVYSSPVPPHPITDIDGLPVAHQLPSISQPNLSFNASIAPPGQASGVSVAYTGSGIYFVALTPRLHGSFELVLQLGSERRSLLGSATCPTEEVSLATGECGCSAGKYRSSVTASCESCKPGTSSVAGSHGADDCSVCDEGSYRATATSQVSSCTLCADGATCPWNAAVHTLQLRDHYWRLSPSSTDIQRCKSHMLTCIGGSNVGQCAPGRSGPLCVLCGNHSGQFRDKETGLCLDCPDTNRQILMSLAVCVAIVCIVVMISGAYFRPTRVVMPLSLRLHEAEAKLSGLDLPAKIKILTAFCALMLGVESAHRARESTSDIFTRCARI